MATTQTAIEKSPATAEFDKKLEVMYNKLYAKIEKANHNAVTVYKLNLDSILAPGNNESEAMVRRYNQFRRKLMGNIELMSRKLVATGSITLFNMYSQNRRLDGKFEVEYNKIRTLLLDRVAVAVSKMLPSESLGKAGVSDFLFPTANTRLYTIRFELLKQRLLSKMWKGISNIKFYAGKTEDGKEVPLTTQADVPIDTFILPTTHTKYYTLHMEALKHFLLAKIWKGVHHMRFYGGIDADGKTIPLTTQADIPLESFLIPTRNSAYVAVQYELIKMKLLRKINKAVKHLKFNENADVNFMDSFIFPSEIGEKSKVSMMIGKAVSKAIVINAKAVARGRKQESKANEYQQYQQQTMWEHIVDLDEERNEILKKGFFGGGNMFGGRKQKTTTMKQNADGTWEAPSIASTFASVFGVNASGILTKKLVESAPKYGKAVGSGFAVAAAAYVGWEIGQAITRTEWYQDLKKTIEDKRYANKLRRMNAEQADKSLRNLLADPTIPQEIKNMYMKSGGMAVPVSTGGRSGAQQRTNFRGSAIANQERFMQAMEEYYNRSRNGGVLNQPVPSTTSSQDMNALLNAVNTTNNLLGGMGGFGGSTIINPRPNQDFNLQQSLDAPYYLRR